MTDEDARMFAQAVEQLQREMLAQGEQIATLAEKLNEAVAMMHAIVRVIGGKPP